MQDLELLLDITFLDWLDTQVHARKEIAVKGSKAYVDEYTRKLKLPEIECVCDIVRKDKFLFYPSRISQGTDVAFVIAGVHEGTLYPILQFTERQLPAGYSFQTLSHLFTSKQNKSLATTVGLTIKDSKADYIDKLS